MSLLDAFRSSAPVRTPVRKIPTGLLLVDNMITGVPLRGITLLLGDAKNAVDVFMRQVTIHADEHIPRKYKCVVDFDVEGGDFEKIDVWCFEEFVARLSVIDNPVFCMSNMYMSIDVSYEALLLSKFKSVFCSGLDNALVVYLDQQAGVPKAVVDWMIMQATCVLKFSEMDNESLVSLGATIAKKSSVSGFVPVLPSGARITVIKRPLSSSPLRTAYFPYDNSGLYDALSVFHHLLDKGTIIICGVDVGCVYYCCNGLNKFTFDEWLDSFDDLRSFLANQI